MHKGMLGTLLIARNSTIVDLRTKSPSLADDVVMLVREAEATLLKDALADMPEPVRAKVEQIDLANAPGDLVEHFRVKLVESGLDHEHVQQVLQRARKAQLGQGLKPNQPIGAHPAVAKLLATARVREVSAVARLPEAETDAITQAAPALSALDDATLTRLVSEKKLTDAHAKVVGLSAALYELTDDNTSLATAIRSASFSRLGGKPPTSTADLAKLSAADWTSFFTSTKVALPAGATSESMSTVLAGRFATLHPGVALTARLPRVDVAQMTSALRDLGPLLQHNPNAVEASFANLDVAAFTAPQRDQLRPLHTQLARLIRAYPGLELAAVLDDPGLSPDTKARTIARRVGLVHQVTERLGEVQLLQLDLSPGSADIDKLGIGKLGANAEEQGMVLSTFRSYQRAWTLATDVDDVYALIEKGFSSAVSISTQPFATFQASSGLDAAKAKSVWDGARTSLADVTLTAGSIVDTLHGLFDKLGVGNQPLSINEHLKKLAGFQDLFGRLSFCACEECQSILGPAAYFVDLMKFIDENLRNQFSGHPNHPLDLKVRRPDLWTLDLSCANTNDRVPTLEIVGEILENYIAKRRGYTGPLTDRAAISKLVYGQTLLKAVDSFNQPFHLPILRIGVYLATLGHTRAEIADALAASTTARVQAELGLSALELKLITTQDVVLSHLSHIYGVTFSSSGAGVANVDAQVLGPAMGLSRDELEQLVATTFLDAGGAHVSISAAKLDANSVQNDVEWVKGLTADALDRMHRFTRLARKAGWSIPELDLVLKALRHSTIGPTGVEEIAEFHAIQARLGVTVAEVCALFDLIPQTPAGTSLFDRLFNQPSFVAADGRFPKPNAHFIHPAFRQSTSAPVAPALPRLLAGLAVDLDGLSVLARRLAPYLLQEASQHFDPDAASDDDRYFLLSMGNLSLLYRHARLTRLLRVSLDDLFQLLGFIGVDHIAGLPDLRALLDLHAFWQQSGYRLDDIAIAIGQAPRDAARYPGAASVAAQLVESASTALAFTDTVFAVALGTTEQGSRDLLLANTPGFLDPPVDGKWRLTAGIDLDSVTITIPQSATVPTPPAGIRLLTADEVREALRPYLAAEVLVRSLGKALGLTTDKVVALAAFAGQSLTADAVVKAMRGDGPIEPLTLLVSSLLPLAVVFEASVWDAAAINFVRQQAALFGNDVLPHTVADAQHPSVPWVTLPQLRALSTFARVAQRRLGSAPDAPTVSPADLKDVLTAFDASVHEFPSSSNAAMARVLGIPSGLVVGLRGRVTLPGVAALALDQLDRAAQLATALGVDGESFGALVAESDDHVLLSHAADALVAALGARYPDEAVRVKKLDEAEQPIREAKRDALADYLIHSVTPKIWGTLDDLYQYFLIDTEAGGCSTTSRVVAATMSAQLYVHRAIMNLEQGDLPPNDPNHVALHMPADAAAEWEWRKNYRVWQANRKVFLWPENYLDPDLRDDKTPLFKDLEQELLQTDINDQNVLDAYTKYLKGLEDAASLIVAGAYHHVRSKNPAPGQVGDVLHLFGATAADPPIYYYRTCENLIASGRNVNTAAVWSPWQKITVQITGRKVSPVVHEGRLHVFWIDIKSRSVNQVKDGESKFAGYRHQMSLKFTTLRPDGTWTAPQEVQLPNNIESFEFGPGRGQVKDPLINGIARLDPWRRSSTEAIDDYTISGPNWDWVWLQSKSGFWFFERPTLRVAYRNFQETANIDLFGRKADPDISWGILPGPYPQFLTAKKVLSGAEKKLYFGTPTYMVWTPSGFANLILDEERLDVLELDGMTATNALDGSFTTTIATIPASTGLLALPGSEDDVLLQVGNDVLLLQSSVYDTNGSYLLRRLGTTMVEGIARRLFEDGLDGLLDTHTQFVIAEAGLPITRTGAWIVDGSNRGKLDFKGPYGAYYRELFFHIPFLIANALNSRGRFASAQRWYHHIFDPTATEVIDVTGVPPAEVAHRLLDRVWRYREFRGLDVERLRDILTDEVAIALYKKDPFNPWAIARRRICAFQKAIVMKYVDNLLDWADSLFTQFTMESVNEALMLYIMASDVLGPRPAELGDCGAGVKPNTYEKIGPLVDSSSEILVELETWLLGARISDKRPRMAVATESPKYATSHRAILHTLERNPLMLQPPDMERGDTGEPSPEAIGRPLATPRDTRPAGAELAATSRMASEAGMFRGMGWNETRTSSWGPALGNASVRSVDKLGGRSFDHASKGGVSAWVGRFGFSIIRQLTPVFCVPANTDLLAYWDRVEDRLYKIRNCMDIEGQKRELALFAPPINPMQLVAMKAAGLSLDDVLGAGSGNLPPYRFLYLLDRAKAFAASLSGFGAALLAALEKKDAEQLNRLRLTQQMNLAQHTTQIRQLEIQVASESLEALRRQRDAAQYRSDFYANLISQNRNACEIGESITRHGASAIHLAESIMDGVAAGLTAIPQVGSPFAMKYGGVELGGMMSKFGNMISAIAHGMEAMAASFSLEANFLRRSEGWKNQRKLADYDIKSLDRQSKAAELRLEIANRSLDIHQEGIDQLQDLLNLTDGKFTNLGLYTWLSTQLQRLYRGAYQNALALAKLAEQAYRFERGDDTLPGLAPSYWDPAHAGLLAGEQLLLGLQTLERRYLETNYRALEVDQAFALSQIDAQALVSLRESGECRFAINEVFFDLFYPGHYKRRIKAVRLTLPCITGPYVNVSASLKLEKSWVRPTATPGTSLVEIPPSRSVSIATSTAQNDAGVFELSFRDERYMPFEGLGAISEWYLTLPKSFRQFDYQTINDAILSISYTAEQDGALRDRVELQNAALEGTLLNYFSNNSARRLFSLRQDFSSAFTRLLRSPAGTQVKVELSDRSFPMLFRNRNLQVTRGVVLLRTATGTAPAGFQITIDGMVVTTFNADPTLGNLPGQTLPGAFTTNLLGQHTVVINAADVLAPSSPPLGDTSAVDPEKLLDILFYLEYKLA